MSVRFSFLYICRFWLENAMTWKCQHDLWLAQSQISGIRATGKSKESCEEGFATSKTTVYLSVNPIKPSTSIITNTKILISSFTCSYQSNRPQKDYKHNMLRAYLIFNSTTLITCDPPFIILNWETLEGIMKKTHKGRLQFATIVEKGSSVK